MPERVLTGQALEMLQMIPPFLQGERNLQAIYAAVGPEYEALDAAIDTLLDDVIVETTDEQLGLWEKYLGLAVANPDFTLEERRSVVKAVLRRAVSDQSGLDWIANVTTILSSDWTYTTHDPDDPFSAPANTIVVFIPYTVGAARARQAEVYIRSITPANTLLNVTYSQGFILGESQLSEDLL